jgi:hypothetical protein
MAYHVLRLLKLAFEILGSRGEDDSVCVNCRTPEDEDLDIRACR